MSSQPFIPKYTTIEVQEMILRPVPLDTVAMYRWIERAKQMLADLQTQLDIQSVPDK